MRKDGKRPGPKEKDITRGILDLLKSCNVWAFKHWSGPMSKAGISDILGIHEGRFLAIEVKTASGSLSPAQARFLANVVDRGGIGFVARSAEDVIRRLKLPVIG
jgi:hypothetical protein